MKNAWGYDLPNGTYEAAYDAEDGNGLVLTLNASIQSTLEKYRRTPWTSIMWKTARWAS